MVNHEAREHPSVIFLQRLLRCWELQAICSGIASWDYRSVEGQHTEDKLREIARRMVTVHEFVNDSNLLMTPNPRAHLAIFVVRLGVSFCDRGKHSLSEHRLYRLYATDRRNVVKTDRHFKNNVSLGSKRYYTRIDTSRSVRWALSIPFPANKQYRLYLSRADRESEQRRVQNLFKAATQQLTELDGSHRCNIGQGQAGEGGDAEMDDYP